MLVRDKLSKLISNLKSNAFYYKLWAPVVLEKHEGWRRKASDEGVLKGGMKECCDNSDNTDCSCSIHYESVRPRDWDFWGFWTEEAVCECE